MQNITLLCIGSIKQKMYVQAISFFTERIKHSCKFTIVELPDSKQKDTTKKQTEETTAIITYIQKNPSTYYTLDELGKSLTSKEFAQCVKKSKDVGKNITFIIGGAYGFSPAIQQIVQNSICLSRCTFTHELCRLIFTEQLYRALQINKGTSYHH